MMDRLARSLRRYLPDPFRLRRSTADAASPQAFRSDRRLRWKVACPLLVLWTTLAHGAVPRDVVRQAQQRVVKIYGAGGLEQMEAYQSGVLIDPEGRVLTVLSYVLDTDDLAVVLDDGRKYAAQVVGYDPVRELAVLQLPLEERERLPAFSLAGAPRASVGERVLAVSNLYGIASGDEPASIMAGVITAVAPLRAQRGEFEFRFHEPAYVLDLAANNPGAAGGALVDDQGRLVGLLGKELRSQATGAWLNYALPIDEIADAVARMGRGETLDDETPAVAPDNPQSLAALGIVLVPNVLPRTPPFVDSVFAESPAERAGLRADDLIVFVEDQPAASCDDVAKAIALREADQAVRLSVLRGGKVIDVQLSTTEPSKSSDERSREPSSAPKSAAAVEGADADAGETAEHSVDAEHE